MVNAVFQLLAFTPPYLSRLLHTLYLTDSSRIREVWREPYRTRLHAPAALALLLFFFAFIFRKLFC